MVIVLGLVMATLGFSTAALVTAMIFEERGDSKWAAWAFLFQTATIICAAMLGRALL